MTTIATADGPIASLVKRTKDLWGRKGLNPAQAAIWWDALRGFGIGTTIDAIEAFYAEDCERERPIGEPRLHAVKRHARRISRESWQERRIGTGAHPDNECSEIRYIRLWWESWRDSKRWDNTRNEVPDWAQEILSEHAAHGVDLADWQAWHAAWQEWASFAFYRLPRAVASEKQRMGGEQVGDATPTTEQPEQGGLQSPLASLHKRLLDLPRVGYKTQAAKEHWIDRVEFAAAEFEVELEGAIKGHTRDDIPF